MPFPALRRADLPAEFTPDSLRQVPMGVLRRLARPDNGVLDADEQRAFDAALHDLMGQMAQRINQQVQQTDWQSGRRRGGRGGKGGPGQPPSREQRNLDRIARRIDSQVAAVEGLAPGIDWSGIRRPMEQLESGNDVASQSSSDSPTPTDSTPTDSAPTTPAEPAPTGPPREPLPPSTDDASEGQTVSDVERNISDQVELVEVMNDIAEVSRRTYALEQQREAANTRGVFFGFLVSIAVIIAGWAPLVAVGWHERWTILGLTLVTCLVAGAVYAVVMRRQRSDSADDQ